MTNPYFDRWAAGENANVIRAEIRAGARARGQAQRARRRARWALVLGYLPTALALLLALYAVTR